MARSIAANAFSFLILLMIVGGGVLAWSKAQFVAVGPLAEPAIITVDRGDNLVKVTRKLVELGAINNEQIFRVGARYTDQDSRLKYGEYNIPAGASMEDILAILVAGKSIQYFVTIPEGMYVAEILRILERNEDLTGSVDSVPAEGWLAPETYSFQRGDSRQSIIDRMLASQVAIVDEAWENRAADLPLASKDELLIMASIVESEAGGAGEWALVASVFYNRLAANMRLQADATIRYGLTMGEERLRRGLFQSELTKETPYNTYQIPALTPTPISNPGRNAIMATANPENSGYYYFVLDGSGGHAFAENHQEHIANVAEWRRIEAERAAD